ncbi:hypothetical protein DFH94DRAFT_686876 [Russula ochroleuca]|uniref:Uncharacterized protein n=1 Tax=Russula ochroleuca TaxID=152965 RepID=A0A9P5JTL3_9AGAM|nr:hypothetical protein DFH94DRAFT_686876 [Russula ochroleuca]
MDAIILEAVKPQEDLMRQPVAETEEERVDIIINLRTAWVHRNHPMASPSFLFAEDLCIITRRPDLQYSTLATTYATNSRSPSVLQRQSQTSSPSGRASAGSTWRPKWHVHGEAGELLAVKNIQESRISFFPCICPPETGGDGRCILKKRVKKFEISEARRVTCHNACRHSWTVKTYKMRRRYTVPRIVATGNHAASPSISAALPTHKGTARRRAGKAAPPPVVVPFTLVMSPAGALLHALRASILLKRSAWPHSSLLWVQEVGVEDSCIESHRKPEPKIDDGTLRRTCLAPHECRQKLTAEAWTEDLFWTRYLFRVHQISEEEERRNVVLSVIV